MPYRVDPDGQVEVMLITSRGGQRWVPPKGNLMTDRAPHEAAAQEAYEEAGVLGRISPEPLGAYRCLKSRANGGAVLVDVTLYPMRVDARAGDWPEKGQRTILWFEPGSAARAVREPGLAGLIARFRPPAEPVAA